MSFFSPATLVVGHLYVPLSLDSQKCTWMSNSALGPAVVAGVPIIAGWLAVTSILATDVAPVGIEAGAFAGAVVNDMFGNLDQEKPWVGKSTS